MKKRNEEVYIELTTAGVVLCAVLGASAEGIIFWGLGLRTEHIPFFAAVFLWGLFGFMVSGVLILADSLREFFSSAAVNARSENIFLQGGSADRRKHSLYETDIPEEATDTLPGRFTERRRRYPGWDVQEENAVYSQKKAS